MPLSNSTLLLESPIPKQIEPSALAFMNNVKTAIIAISFTSFGLSGIISILLGTSLQFVLDQIKSQQLVILLYLFNVNVPDSVKIVFQSLLTISAFEIMPIETIYIAILGINEIEGQSFNSKFEELGL